MQIAEVIQIRQQLTTWEDVRAEYGKMAQMGYQSVVQAAKVGAMLIELKRDTPHGEFVAKVTRALLLDSERSGKMQASRLMRLAANRTLLEEHKPQSQRAALTLIAEHKPYRVGWTRLLVDHLGLSYATLGGGDTVKRLRTKLGDFPAYFTDPAVAQEFIENYLRVIGRPEKVDEHASRTRSELKAEQVKKLDAAVKAERIRLGKSFEAEVESTVARRIAIQRASYEKLEEDAREREAQFRAATATIDVYLTEDEFKLILNCLHPDRAPEDRRERFSQAFAIFKRLESYVNHKLPLSVLRERGWAK